MLVQIRILSLLLCFGLYAQVTLAGSDGPYYKTTSKDICQTLLEDGAPTVSAKEYRLISNRLGFGSRVGFSDGVEYELVEKLGQGSTTQVWLTNEFTALRFPLAHTGMNEQKFQRMTGYINSFIEAHNVLKQVPNLVLDVYKFQLNEFIEIEVFEEDFILSELLSGRLEMSAEDRNRVKRDLLQFARDAALVAGVADARAANIAYQFGTGFRLIDMMAPAELLASVPDLTYHSNGETTFDAYLFTVFQVIEQNADKRVIPLWFEWRDEVMQALYDERKTLLRAITKGISEAELGKVPGRRERYEFLRNAVRGGQASAGRSTPARKRKQLKLL